MHSPKVPSPIDLTSLPRPLKDEAYMGRLPVDFLTIGCEMPWDVARRFVGKTQEATQQNIDRFKELIRTGDIAAALDTCFTPDCGETLAAWHEWLSAADIEHLRRKLETYQEVCVDNRSRQSRFVRKEHLPEPTIFHRSTGDYLGGAGHIVIAWQNFSGYTAVRMGQVGGCSSSTVHTYWNGVYIGMDKVRRWAEHFTNGDVAAWIRGPHNDPL